MRESAFASLGLGWFSDVAFLNGRLYLIGGFDVPGSPGQVDVRIYDLNPLDVREHNLVMSERLAAGYGYSRIYATNGSVWAAWNTGSVGKLWPVGSANPPQVLAPCENSSPVCFGNGAFAWQGAQVDGWPVSVLSLSDGWVRERVRGSHGTGLSRIDAAGHVILVDEDRLALPGTTIPCFALDLAVGEGPDGGTVWQLGTERGIVWPGQFAGTPRCAAEGDLRAIATGGGPGVRVFCGTRAELLTLRAKPPIDPPIDPIDPGGDPMQPMAPRHIEVVRDVFRQYGARFNPGNDDTRGTLVDIVVHRLRKLGDVHAPRFGRKLKGDGHTLNTDTVTYDRGDGFFEIYDVVLGGSFGNPVDYACWNDAEQGPIFRNGANGSWTLPLLKDTDAEPDVKDPGGDPGGDDGGDGDGELAKSIKLLLDRTALLESAQKEDRAILLAIREAVGQPQGGDVAKLTQLVEKMLAEGLYGTVANRVLGTMQQDLKFGPRPR